MAKKKNPEQPVEEQDQEPETEEVEDSQQDQPQDESEQDSEEQEGTEDPADEEGPQDQQEEPKEGVPAQEPASDESAALKRDLLQAQGELAAYRAGVAPNMVADAVTLAMAEAAKSGEVTEAAVAKAMEAVLKRHPEWKASEGGKQKGGFKLGVDRDSGSACKKTAGTTNQNVKRWNRFK